MSGGTFKKLLHIIKIAQLFVTMKYGLTKVGLPLALAAHHDLVVLVTAGPELVPSHPSFRADEALGQLLIKVLEKKLRRRFAKKCFVEFVSTSETKPSQTRFTLVVDLPQTSTTNRRKC